MSIQEFEAIIDQATNDVGDPKMLFAEVYFLQENFEKSGRSVRLQQLVAYAKEFEVTRQHRRKSSTDLTMLCIAAMGMPLSRKERRAQKKGKSGSFPKKNKKR